MACLFLILIDKRPIDYILRLQKCYCKFRNIFLNSSSRLRRSPVSGKNHRFEYWGELPLCLRITRWSETPSAIRSPFSNYFLYIISKIHRVTSFRPIAFGRHPPKSQCMRAFFLTVVVIHLFKLWDRSTYLFIDDTEGTLSWLQIPSASSLSLISHANMVGFSLL